MSAGKHVKKGLKQFGSAIGAGMTALAEAQREADRQAAEAAKVEQHERLRVEDQIAQYEEVVGKPFVMKDAVGPSSFMVMWDSERRGHLINCPPHCMRQHCLQCGTESFAVYCNKHRP